MVERQTYRSTVQNREPASRPEHIWSFEFLQSHQGNSLGESIAFSTNGVGTNIYIENKLTKKSLILISQYKN